MLRFVLSVALIAVLISPVDGFAQAADKKKKKKKGDRKKPAVKQQADGDIPPARMSKKALLEKYDTNKDGKLDSKERKEIRKDNYAWQRKQRASRSRLTPFQQALLKQFDKNKDGQLDKEEQATAQKEITKRRKEYYRQLQQRLRGGRGGRGGARGGRSNPQQQFQQLQRRLLEQRRKQQQLRKQGAKKQ